MEGLKAVDKYASSKLQKLTERIEELKVWAGVDKNVSQKLEHRIDDLESWRALNRDVFPGLEGGNAVNKDALPRLKKLEDRIDELEGGIIIPKVK